MKVITTIMLPLVIGLIAVIPNAHAILMTNTNDISVTGSLDLLPAWTGLPAPLPASFSASGTATVEMDPSSASGNPDTIDVELVSMNLTGTLLGFPIAINAGLNNGVYPSLAASTGMLSEAVGTPPNGQIDVFPISAGDNFFDVFFDIWIGLDADNIADLGEVVRNFTTAVTIENLLALDQLPLTAAGQYSSMGPANLNVVNLDGTNFGIAHANFNEATFTVQAVPEPTTLTLLSLGLVGLGAARRKNKA